MADLPITSDKGATPVVINDPITTANVMNVNADGSINVEQVADAATLTNVAQSATSVQLVAANTNRIGLMIYNDAGQPLYVKFGTTASITSFTVLINNTTLYEVPLPVYTGEIDGIWKGAGSGAARITELT